MENRRRKRFARRLQIRYWPRGETRERKAYTTNISTTGAFVATNGPLAPGAKLRIEFLGENGFIAEAIVSHAARVSTSLQSIRSSGMGIRFLRMNELLRDFLPTGGQHETDTISEATLRKTQETARARGDRIFEETQRRHLEAKLGSEENRTSGDHPTDDDKQVATRKQRSSAGGAPVYTVGFRNVAYLLDAIENEISFGGVFVPTDSPAKLQTPVRVALALPAPIRRTVHAEAIIVRINDPAKETSDSTIKGMGVAFEDTTKVLEEINKLIEQARPGAAIEPSSEGEG